MVIFTDSRFGIARAKADDMSVIIRNCLDCELLEVVDMRLDKVREGMPGVLLDLRARFGERWSYSLGINDLYFDAMADLGVAPEDLVNISAGNGSPSAFQRIRAGRGQTATVAEPLNLQGWQLVDELNRAFAGERPSGYIPRAHLVAPETVRRQGSEQDIYDPNTNYRAQYRQIWGR